MIALFLYFFDFLCFALFGGWYVQSLLIYFVFKQLMAHEEEMWAWGTFYVPMVLLLLQNCFLNGRFGLALIYLVPLSFFAKKVRVIFLDAAGTLLCLFIINTIIFEQFFIKKLVLGVNVSLRGTLLQICVNLCLGSLVLWGTRGNRSLLKFFSKGRKVWTPNRKGALWI